MSATSPDIIIETDRAGAPPDVRRALLRLDFQRRLWRALAVLMLTAACALTLLCLFAFADYRWLLSRATRIALVSPVLCGAFLSSVDAVCKLLRRRTLTDVAREVERVTGSERNVLVTFAENEERPQVVAMRGYMRARLERQALDDVAAIDGRAFAPRASAVRGATALASLLLLMLAARLLSPPVFAREVERVLWLKSDEATAQTVARSVVDESDASGPISVDDFRVRVVPPAYAGLSVEDVEGDAPIKALAGSQVEVSLHVRGTVEGASLRFNNTVNQLRALGENRFGGAFQPNASGAFEVRVLADESRAPAPLVRAVEVYNDAVPEARITEPASDQLLKSVPGVPIAVRWTARDDLGLASVILKYIKSRGEGDAAKFTSGEVAVEGVARASGREWRGAARLDLTRLNVQAGDTLVFWIEARDRNPLANNMGRSASLAIAVAGPEALKLNLSDLRPNEIARFLLSERQIIINTEKLHNERARLAQAELLRRAGDIAADQREFKNSFNEFIKIEGAGSEEETSSAGQQSLEDRVRAAEDERTEVHKHGIPDPPTGSPDSVRELIYAIRAMWDAEDALSTADTARALTFEREALARLKRAQTAARYVPPVVAESKPVDLKRRYAGELTEIKTRLEKLARRAPSSDALILRAALADAYNALGDLQSTLDAPSSARANVVGRARERTREAADRLVKMTGGDHAATIAEAAGQLRIVETELSRLELSGESSEYAARLSKSLALLTEAASSLFAIAESHTRAGGSDPDTLLPTDATRAGEYFRRLNRR